LRISGDDEIFQIHLNYPVLAKDEKMRAAVTEFFTRVNYGLVLGAFEVDLRDGEARYHVSHLIGDGRLEDEVIRRIIGSALSTADRYFPAYMRVLFGGDTARRCGIPRGAGFEHPRHGQRARISRNARATSTQSLKEKTSQETRQGRRLHKSGGLKGV
jgi:hypothetical protein